MKRTSFTIFLLTALIYLLINCAGPSASPLVEAPPSPAATAVPFSPTVENYPPPPTEAPPTLTPTPTPPPGPLPVLSLPEAAPGLDFDMAEVALLGMTQTAGVTLKVRLRSGEIRAIPLSPQVAPAGVYYQAFWQESYLFLLPHEQPADMSSAPLAAIDLAGKTVYRLSVNRGYESAYWANPVLSPDGRQIALFLFRLYGPLAGPRWQVLVWDLDAGQANVLLYGDDNRPYAPVYWSQDTGAVYLQRHILESDADPHELATIRPDGSDWQVLDEQLRGRVVFSPDGRAAAYLAHDEQLGAGYTYYNPGLTRQANQLWTLDLRTGEKRLLLQEADGAQLYEYILHWTAGGILVGRARAVSSSAIKEWQVLQVDPTSGTATSLFSQQGEWSGLFAGPFAPKQERFFLYDWKEQLYAVLDLASGEMRSVDPLIAGSSFSWCEEGTALIEWYGNDLYYVDLKAGEVDPLEGWGQVAFCR